MRNKRFSGRTVPHPRRPPWFTGRIGASLYVMTGTGDIARSGDLGATWTTIGTLSQVHMTGFTREGRNLLATTREGLVGSSTDQGTTWSWVGAINQLNVVSLGNDTPLVTGVGPGTLDARLSLQALWPNPRTDGGELTRFSFRLPKGDDVSLELYLYNVEGKLIARRDPESFAGPGRHLILWNMGGLASGVYFVRLSTERGLWTGPKLTVVQ